jgi:mono/diheme cytochrome c family protein
MRRTALVLALFLALFGFAAVGCGGEEESSPTPETVEGPLDTTTETDTTETETTDETGTTTDETETETGGTGGGGGGAGDPAAGKEVFLGTAGCGSCHTLADAGTSGTVGPNLDDAQPSEDLVVDRVTNGAGAMPPFQGTLTEQQIADVAAYVSSVAGS